MSLLEAMDVASALQALRPGSGVGPPGQLTVEGQICRKRELGRNLIFLSLRAPPAAGGGGGGAAAAAAAPGGGLRDRFQVVARADRLGPGAFPPKPLRVCSNAFDSPPPPRAPSYHACRLTGGRSPVHQARRLRAGDWPAALQRLGGRAARNRADGELLAPRTSASSTGGGEEALHPPTRPRSANRSSSAGRPPTRTWASSRTSSRRLSPAPHRPQQRRQRPLPRLPPVRRCANSGSEVGAAGTSLARAAHLPPAHLPPVTGGAPAAVSIRLVRAREPLGSGVAAERAANSRTRTLQAGRTRSCGRSGCRPGGPRSRCVLNRNQPPQPFQQQHAERPPRVDGVGNAGGGAAHG